MMNFFFWLMTSCTPENSAASILTVEDGRTGSPRTVGKYLPHYMYVRENSNLYIVTCRAVFKKHVPAATDTHAIIEVLLEMGFSTVVLVNEL
jgi:hypothetical protein